MQRSRTLIAAPLALAAALAGCAAGTAAPAPAAQPEPAIEALFWARQDSARARFTDADVHFMSGMIAHHAQALGMARLAPTHGAGRQVQTLAARIVNAQQDEIALMQQWLRERGLPVPEVHVAGTSVTVHGDAHATHMRGMLSAAQLAELDRARGREFDRLFLTYMIQHHRGAVEMVHELLATDGAAQDPVVFRFASDVQVDQATEIARMQRMLLEMTTGTRP